MKHKLNNKISLPSSERINKMMNIIKNIVFHDYFFDDDDDYDTFIDDLSYILTNLIVSCSYISEEDGIRIYDYGKHTSSELIDELQEIKRLLLNDMYAIFKNDPSASSISEIILAYPATTALLYYRVAHFLYERHVPILPRMITEQAHSITGIDIHPGATIGEYFCIDHGTGVVIGETSIIGNHVTIYQGVTLGSKNFKYDSEGNIVNEPRHPKIKDNVTIYSNATILGNITIGHDSTIGGNIWVTHDVAPFSVLKQSKTIVTHFENGLGI